MDEKTTVIKIDIMSIVKILLIFALGGCATMGSITQKDNYKFETTGLFIKPCQERTNLEQSNKNKKGGFFAKFAQNYFNRTIFVFYIFNHF